MHVMLASAAMAVMPLLDPIAHREGSLGLSSALRLALIQFYTALLSLIGCQPSVTYLYVGMLHSCIRCMRQSHASDGFDTLMPPMGQEPGCTSPIYSIAFSSAGFSTFDLLCTCIQ